MAFIEAEFPALFLFRKTRDEIQAVQKPCTFPKHPIALEVADLMVLGRDNIVVNPAARPF
ncbi:MAG: hypothetical protein HUU18_06675 [Phycisphaerales bacterium]|nr:hypothetical protein [Phycisphaerales bacterium]